MSNSYPGGLLTAGADTSYSVAFDGSGDSLTAPQGAPFQFPGDFTMECWLFANNSAGGASYDGVFDTRSGNVVSSNSAGVNYKDNGYLNMYVAGANTASSTLLGSNKWVHVALVRSGSTVTLYQNGISVASASTSANLSDGYFTVGGFVSAGYWSGFISNVRVVKGTAVYTSNFTPPTQLFTIPNTSILVCQSPTIIDKSGNNVTITVNGDAKVSNFTPFAGYKGFDPALGSAAGGVWTLEQATSYQSNRTWPIYDPYFNQTTLLLHGNGTNGANNNSFVDSSSNNFAITRNGNTTQGSFSPFSQTGWSAYNSGSSSYCQLNNADYSLGTGDFTVECWMFVTTDKANNAICTSPSNPNFGVLFGGGSSNARSFYLEYASAVTTIGTISGFLNKWTHIAVVRSGGICTVYQNGVSVGSASKAGSVGSTANLYLLRNSGDAGQDFPGYITDLRITKAAVYTSNFIPNTKPLTVAPNTLLLTFQSNRFVDNSALNTTVTPTATTIQAFSPFVPAYITPTTYSNYFDGSGDYLTAPNAAWMNLGTSDFTMECWTQFNTVGSTQMFVSNNYNAGNGAGGWAFLYRQDNTTLVFTCNSNVAYGKTFAPVVGRWYHVAVCRSGTDLRLFVDGTQIGTTSTSSDNITGASSSLFVGSNETNALPMNGLISNLRIVKGTALYTTNFTPSSSPLTAITNTQLLTCQDSTFKDNSVNAASFTAYGNVQPVSSPTPFPANVDTTTLNSAYSTSLVGGSYYGDGTGDYLVNNSDNLQIGSSSNFTLEFWVYRTSSFTSDQGRCVFAIGSETTNRMQFTLYGAAARIEVYGGALDFNGGTIPANAWTHVAFVRSGSTITIYINGVAATTASWSGVIGATGGFIFGANRSVSNYIDCPVSGLRLLNGTALYTSNFAPPTAPPTPITNTSLLLNFTNAGIIDNTAKNTFETVGTAQLSSTQAKYGGTSIKLDGSTSSWLYLPFNRGLDISTGAPDWTLECWGFVSSFSNSPYFFNKGGVAATYYTNYSFSMNSSGVVYCTLGNNSGETSYSFGTCATNTWYHFAATRSGSTIRTFLNGVLVTTSSLTTTMTDNGEGLYVGCLKNLTSNVLNGYVNDLRITKGYARYLNNFTPPTSSFQNQ